MGIPYYVASLLRVHKHIQRRLVSGYKVDLFAIDFNCFIHHALKAENPIGSIVVALYELMQTVEANQVYIAFDGLVPYAKMVQQRYRRMRN
jgi:5'-3' exonuclease